MSKQLPFKRFWWAFITVAVLVLAGWVTLASGVLAIWLDPEPESDLGASPASHRAVDPISQLSPSDRRTAVYIG